VIENHCDTPATYAAMRRFFPDHNLLGSHAALLSNWNYSARTLSAAAAALEASPLDDCIASIVVAGSLGRMEAAAYSDCDIIVVVDDETDPNSEQSAKALSNVWQRLEALELRLPKSWGIFSNACNTAALTQPESLGDLNESRDIFGKRIQLLLDCQPVYERQNITQIPDLSTYSSFRSLQKYVVDWYATAFVNAHKDKQWTYLLNDLIRYFRSYAAWHQFKLTVEHDDSWYIRNAKLRTSRLIMYAGLLFLLGESSRIGFGKPKWLLDHLTLTPLERVLYAFARHGYAQADTQRFLENYNAYFETMRDPQVRASLVDSTPTQVTELPPQFNASYAIVAEHAAQLQTALMKFTLSRLPHWHPKFTEYLVF
jgi:predicted nucleotidyltransferase